MPVLRGDAFELGRELGARDVAQRTAPALAPIERLDALAQRPGRRALEVEVERRLDAQASFKHRVAAEPLEEMAAHLLGELGGGGVVLALARTSDHGCSGDLALVASPRR